MPIIEIDGVGRVEVDDSFLQMSEADQAATVNQIVAQSNRGRQKVPPKTNAAPAPRPTSPVQPDFVEPTYTPAEGGTFGGGIDDIDTNGDGFYSDEEYAAAEEAYQDSSAPQPQAAQPAGKSLKDLVNPNGKAEKEDKVPWWQSAMIGAGQGVTFNHLDEITAGVNTILPGRDSVWETGDLGESYDRLVDRYRKVDELVADEDPGSYYGGAIAGSFAVPLGAGKTAARGLTGTAKATRAAGEGFAGGALAGFGAGEGNPLERLDDAALGATIGAAGGAAVSGLGHAISKDRRIENWVAKQLKTNPHARMDAEIVADLVAAREKTARAAADPQGRAKLTAKEINDVQDSYTDSVRRMVQALDIPPSKKNELFMALERKFSASDEIIDSIKGTVEGDAVADAILRTQRLRALTPEIKTGSNGPVKRLVELASGAAGAYTGGPIGASGAYGVSRYLLSRVGNAEASRANAADKLLKRADFYKALGDRAGPSEMAGSKDALVKTYNELVDGVANRKALAAYQRQAEKADRELLQSIRNPIVDERDLNAPLDAIQRKATLKDAKDTASDSTSALARFNQKLKEQGIVPDKKLAEKDLRSAIDNPMVDERDLAAPQLAADRKALIKDAKDVTGESGSALKTFERRLREEGVIETPTKPNQANAVSEAIDANVAAGIPGNTRTQEVIANMVGVPKEDMLRGLDKIAEKYPALKGDIDRIRLNWNTSNRGVGTAIAPAIRKVLEEDGTVARLAAQAEEAQARVAARQKMMSGEAPEAPPMPARDAPAPKQQDMDFNPTVPASVGEKLSKAELDDYATFFRSQASDREDGMIGFVGGFGGRSEDDAAIYDYLKAKGYGPFIRGEADELPRSVSATPEPQMRGIDRPDQWAQGRERYQSQAKQAIDGLMSDSELPDDVFAVIGNSPTAVMENFKTTEAALDFIDNQVLPDLRAEGMSNGVISRVRSHLVAVANAKPYRTQDDFEAGTRTNK